MTDFIPTLPDETQNKNLLPLFERAAQFVGEHATFSTADLQRHLSCGYGSVVKVIDALLSLGVIEKTEGDKPYRARTSD